MTEMARRIVARYLEAVQEIPVRNKETGRIVYVLPETLRDEPSRFQRISPAELELDERQGRPAQPEKPRKPRKPHKPRDPIPIPPPYPKPPLPPKLPKPPKRVKPVKPVPVPVPPEPRKTPLFPNRGRYKDD